MSEEEEEEVEEVMMMERIAVLHVDCRWELGNLYEKNKREGDFLMNSELFK